MQNMELSEIRTAANVSNGLEDNDEFYHCESDRLRTSEAIVEVQGKLLQYTCSFAVVGI
jgi:hypothetical protein